MNTFPFPLRIKREPPSKSTVTIVDEPESPYLPYRYRVPGVAKIGSQVRLPELEWFRDAFLSLGPFDLEIVVGRFGNLRSRSVLRRRRGGHLEYQEHLGSQAANFRLDPETSRMRLTAAPMLARSPHVLYTNVVEALLRFLAVGQGRLLLHSACVELGGQGLMLSARTDTGKTGTILRLLRDAGARFLSDDMTILDPDGTAHCYPKPLTISKHTLRAVNADVLSPHEWRWLRLQSRLHSKEGRTLGMRLAEMNVPIMTLNALTQVIVPPPKYDADRLVACSVTREVKVVDLFIIERGTEALSDVAPEDALDELLENTDDAYGFPPFRHLAPSFVIGGRNYAELRDRERELLRQTLGHVRVRRMARDDFSWADGIMDLLCGTRRTSIQPGGNAAQQCQSIPTVVDLRGSYPAHLTAASDTA